MPGALRRLTRLSNPPSSQQVLSATRVLYTAPSGRRTSGRFIFVLTNAGNTTLVATLAGEGGAGVLVHPAILTLAAGATAPVTALVPAALLNHSAAASVRVSNATATLALVALLPSAFPVSSSSSSSTSSSSSEAPSPGSGSTPTSYDAGSQAALVICGLLLAGGVGLYCRRRYRNSLLQQREQLLHPHGSVEQQQLLGPAQGGGFDLVGPPPRSPTLPPGGAASLQLGPIPGGLRKPGRRGESPQAVGLVLGAGTVVATPQEAVLGGAQARLSQHARQSRGAARGDAAAGGLSGAGHGAPNWDGWGDGGDDGGWDLSNSSLLGSDNEGHQAEGAAPDGSRPRPAPPPLPAKPVLQLKQQPQPQQQGTAAPHRPAAAAVQPPQGSDSDWEA